MNNSHPLNIKFIFSNIEESSGKYFNVNQRQISLLNILYLFSFLTYFIILILIATTHLIQTSCYCLYQQLATRWIFFSMTNFCHALYIVVLFLLNVNYVASKIFSEYSRKTKQDFSMTQSPAKHVPRVSWLFDRFDSVDSVFFSTIKTIEKATRHLGTRLALPQVLILYHYSQW